MSTIIEKKINNIKTMLELYASAQDVVVDCETRQMTSDRFENMREEDLRKSWHGVGNYSEALGLMRTGYQPTVEKLKESVKANLSGNGKRISFKNNIVGANPVVPLAMIGVPNCMIDMQMKPIKCKVIDVYYDTTVGSSTSPEQIIENGQKLLSAILELESQGYKFNLYAVQTYYDRDNGVDVLAVRIKSSSQPLDIKRISVPLTHPSFFRVIGFDWYSKTPKGTYRSCYGRALCYEFSNDKAREWGRELWGDNAIYISGKEIMNRNEEYIKEVFLNGSKK